PVLRSRAVVVRRRLVRRLLKTPDARQHLLCHGLRLDGRRHLWIERAGIIGERTTVHLPLDHKALRVVAVGYGMQLAGAATELAVAGRNECVANVLDAHRDSDSPGRLRAVAMAA